jgi:hypothetical protein
LKWIRRLQTRRELLPLALLLNANLALSPRTKRFQNARPPRASTRLALESALPPGLPSPRIAERDPSPRTDVPPLARLLLARSRLRRTRARQALAASLPKSRRRRVSCEVD